MSSIVKLNKGQLSTFASNFKTNSDNVSAEVSDLSSDLSSVPVHEKFAALKTKCSLIADSLGNVDLDFKHLSGNITKYIETLSKIDAEGFDVNASTKGTKSSSTTSSSSTLPSYSTKSTNSNGNTVINNYYNITSRSSGSRPSSGNYSYSYSTSPSGIIVHTSTSATTSNSSVSLFPSSGLTSKDFDVPVGGKYNYEGIEKYLEKEKGVTVEVPEGLGNVHTYMGWQMITAKSSTQYNYVKQLV